MFNSATEYNTHYDNAVKNVISDKGKKMRYFYEKSILDTFFTNYDRISYILEDRPFYKNLIKYDDEYLYFNVLGDNDKDLKDFDYRVNNYGFRNNKFLKLNSNNTNMLVAGCSVTYGMALPESYTWPHLLKNKILKTKHNFHLDNIAVCGIDTFQEIRNIYLYIEKYGKPDIIFMCLPPIYRYPSLEKPTNNISTVQEISWIPNQELLEEYLYDNYKNYSMSFFYNIITIKNLEQYCNDLGINLKWFSWDDATQSFYSLCNFKNLLNYKFQNKYKNDKNEPYWDRGRDNAHIGKMFHLEFADLFFDEWEKYENKHVD